VLRLTSLGVAPARSLQESATSTSALRTTPQVLHLEGGIGRV